MIPRQSYRAVLGAGMKNDIGRRLTNDPAQRGFRLPIDSSDVLLYLTFNACGPSRALCRHELRSESRLAVPRDGFADLLQRLPAEAQHVADLINAMGALRKQSSCQLPFQR